MKSSIKNLVPRPVIEKYRQIKRLINRQQNRRKNIEDVFTDIYRTNIWGGSKGEFCSGSGSKDELIVSSYISMISEKAYSEGFTGLTFADLGCGDFHIGKQLIPLCSRYIGVDIVKPLICRNQELYGSENVRFIHCNIVEEELPDGDVCFIRQVLQHLSNQQIVLILQKLKKYKWVFITEHYPKDNDAIKPNIDKVHGGDIRLEENSGVYLSEPPFGLPEQSLSMVLEVPGSGIEKGGKEGVIRTFLYKPLF